MTPRAARRNKTFKCEDDLWDAAMRKAEERGDVLSEEIRAFLKRYVVRSSK